MIDTQTYLIDKAFHDPANQTKMRKLGFIFHLEEGSTVKWDDLYISLRESWESLKAQLPEKVPFELV